MYIKSLTPRNNFYNNKYYDKFLLKNISKICYTSDKNSIKDVKKLMPNSIIIRFEVEGDKKESFIAFHHYENPMTIALATYCFKVLSNLDDAGINYMDAIVNNIMDLSFKRIPLTSFIYLKKYSYLKSSNKKEIYMYIKKLYKNIKDIQIQCFNIDYYKLSRNNFDLNKVYKGV
jgi:hypothetical protein